MSSMLALHVLAAERGDGLRPELIEALKQQGLADRLSFFSMATGTPAGGAFRFLVSRDEHQPGGRKGRA